jgi:hypothetical protein
LRADEDERLIAKPDENSGVKWMGIEEAVSASTEPWMQGIYRKLNLKLEGTNNRQLLYISKICDT